MHYVGYALGEYAFREFQLYIHSCTLTRSVSDPAVDRVIIIFNQARTSPMTNETGLIIYTLIIERRMDKTKTTSAHDSSV